MSNVEEKKRADLGFGADFEDVMRRNGKRNQS